MHAGWARAAHVKVAPPPLVVQVLHLALRDHDGLLEVVEERCSRRSTHLLVTHATRSAAAPNSDSLTGCK